MQLWTLVLTLLSAFAPVEDRPGEYLEPLPTPTIETAFVYEALWRNYRPRIAMVILRDPGTGDGSETSVGIIEERDRFFVVVSRTKASIRKQYFEAMKALRTKHHIPWDGKSWTLQNDLAALSSVDAGLTESKTPLKKDIACDVSLIWRTVLSEIRPSGRVVIHGTTYVATGSVWGRSSVGMTSSQDPTSPMGAFVALGDSLLKYGQASEAQLVESEKQLTLQMQASAKTLHADISGTSLARLRPLFSPACSYRE